MKWVETKKEEETNSRDIWKENSSKSKREDEKVKETWREITEGKIKKGTGGKANDK